VSWRVVAASATSDDLLLALADGTAAIVHLTYTKAPPEGLPWPATAVFRTSQELESEFLSWQ
jgi:hypothetical protein